MSSLATIIKNNTLVNGLSIIMTILLLIAVLIIIKIATTNKK